VFKWDDLDYELKSHPSNIVPKDLFDYVQTYKYTKSKKELDNLISEDPSTNSDDHSSDNKDSTIRKRKNNKGKGKKENEKAEGPKRFVPSDDKNAEMVTIHSKKDLKNIYDRGWLGNLQEVLLPMAL
jgi:hypothetical protein